MKSAFTLFCTLIYFFANGQEIKGNIKNHESSEMDLVLMLFGMDNPIPIGTVQKNGQFTVNLENVSLENISVENKSMYIGDLYFNFFFSCGDYNAFGENYNKQAVRQDFIRMTSKGEWSGSVFLVSDENLRPWLEDPGYNNAVKGSFYEVIYLEDDANVKMECTNEVYITDEDKVETTYKFDLDLKKGFNWVQYTIEEVQDTDPNIRASFPSKVTISNLKDPSKMLWVGKYH